MSILIKNGHVIDPGNGLDKILDIFVEDGIIKKVGKSLEFNAETIIDASENWVTPGLIDLHVHLRSPGLEYKEEIETGANAAAIGGFTTICAMPNTKPVTDCKEVVRKIYEEAAEKAKVNILPIGSATKGQQGKELTDVKELKEAGVCAISEDGYSVMNSLLLKKSLEECVKNDLPMFSHCEDIDLVDGGVINEGIKSKEFNLRGISNASEEVIVSRDIIISESVGARLHLCHMSTKGCVDIIEDAKKRGAKVTAEATPHHFSICDEDIPSDDGNYKMNPPLRSREDMEAIIRGLKENIIEVIATDHAPHHEDEKNKGFAASANGIVGLETALPLGVTNLVNKGILTAYELIEKMTVNPARVIGLNKGKLSEGMAADIAIIDYKNEYEIDVKSFKSKGKNSPFHGLKVKGKVKHLIVSGNIKVYNYELHFYK